jgi:hypothetical protein
VPLGNDEGNSQELRENYPRQSHDFAPLETLAHYLGLLGRLYWRPGRPTKLLGMLANLQNHDVGTLMRYYNDANISAQATVLINRFNQDFLQSEESNVAAARANDVMPGDRGGDYDQADEVLDDLRSMSEEEVIYSDRYRAEVIAGKQLKNGHLYYLVEWETREPTWERLTSLKQYLDLVEAYEVKSNTEIEAVLANLSKKRKKHGKTKSNKRQKTK